jgi:hypothetical protein
MIIQTVNWLDNFTLQKVFFQLMDAWWIPPVMFATLNHDMQCIWFSLKQEHIDKYVITYSTECNTD